MRAYREVKFLHLATLCVVYGLDYRYGSLSGK